MKWEHPQFDLQINDDGQQPLDAPQTFTITDSRNFVVEDGVSIGVGGFIGNFVVIRTGSKIHDNVVIGHNTVIEENVTIGNNVRIQACCYITKGTVIEDNCFIAPQVTTCNDRYICSHSRPIKSELSAPLIKYGARIGGGSVIAPDIVIGSQAFIGMGSVVTRDIPDNQMWYGCPAKFVRWVPKDELI